MTATTATTTKTTSPRRRRFLSALGITVASLALGVVGQTSTASAQASYGYQPIAYCSSGTVLGMAPPVIGDLPGRYTSGTASWTAELWKYDYSTRTWKYVTGTRSAVYSSQIATNSGPSMYGTRGYGGPSWYSNGVWTDRLYWRVASGTYAVKHWVSDGNGVWVSQFSNYCSA